MMIKLEDAGVYETFESAITQMEASGPIVLKIAKKTVKEKELMALVARSVAGQEEEKVSEAA